MTPQKIIADIHALEEEILDFERKYGLRSETFYAAYMSGEEPEDEEWVLDFGEWASAYRTWLARQAEYCNETQCISWSVTNLNAPLAQTTYLNDAALWQAARSTLASEQRERLAALHEAQQRCSLSVEEQVEEQALLKLYREVVLVRAQAAVLLKQRGYDVGDLAQFEPLE